MNHLDLFTGIAGFSIAAEWVWGEEYNIIAFCENDKFCRKKLKKLWPDVPIYKDITKLNGKEITETIDILTGGWPCQPFSVAGKRRGKKDNRHLWPEMFRVIQETNPTWIIGENVTGITNMELDNVLSDLEGEGYETQTFNIPACGVNARHRRFRIWVVARDTNSRDGNKGKVKGIQKRKNAEPTRICADVSNTEKPRSFPTTESRTDIKEQSRVDFNKKGEWSEIRSNTTGCGEQIVANTSKQDDGECPPEPMQRQIQQSGKRDKSPDVSNSKEERSQGIGTSGEQIAETHARKKLSMCDSSDRAIWPVEPDVGRVAHGVPNRVDRLKALGNAIVPQVAEVIMRGIKEVEDLERK